jgi:hypothetical protein
MRAQADLAENDDSDQTSSRFPSSQRGHWTALAYQGLFDDSGRESMQAVKASQLQWARVR